MLDSLQNAKTNTSTCDYLKQRLQMRHGRDVLVTETCNIPVKAQSFHSLEWKDCGQSQVVTERQFETCHQSYNRRKVTMTSEMDRTKSRPARWKKAERDDVKTNPTQNTWQVENWKTVFFLLWCIFPYQFCCRLVFFDLVWFDFSCIIEHQNITKAMPLAMRQSAFNAFLVIALSCSCMNSAAELGFPKLFTNTWIYNGIPSLRGGSGQRLF